VGTLSEVLAHLGRRLFGRNLVPPRWLDHPLRGLKYLLLAFFLWAILAMSPELLTAFLDGPYNRVADLKMYHFFATLSGMGLGVILVLAGLSVLVQGFWCRYLCPYGALLGGLSLLSPLQIRRNAETCSDCRRCTKVCPARLEVHRRAQVRSDECTACHRCVEACPVQDTLALRLPLGGPAVPGPVLGALVVGLFLAVTGLAILTGHWQSPIPPAEYLRRIPELEAPVYDHTG
jgi:polyferredoxin